MESTSKQKRKRRRENARPFDTYSLGNLHDGDLRGSIFLLCEGVGLLVGGASASWIWAMLFVFAVALLAYLGGYRRTVGSFTFTLVALLGGGGGVGLGTVLGSGLTGFWHLIFFITCLIGIVPLFVYTLSGLRTTLAVNECYGLDSDKSTGFIGDIILVSLLLSLILSMPLALLLFPIAWLLHPLYTWLYTDGMVLWIAYIFCYLIFIGLPISMGGSVAYFVWRKTRGGRSRAEL